MKDLEARTQELSTALELAETLAGPAALASARAQLDAVHRRHGHLGANVLTALTGGTGSGKSSLLNAIAGEEVARPGVLRPTTERPVAWVPRRADPALDRLLDDLGIDDRHPHDGEVELAIVDLPDLDSVERGHRATVDALLPRLDVLVWVLDPQKYNDAAVHELIAARSAYREQLLFVLNQADRLPPDDRQAVVDDLAASLRRDGVAEPEIHLVAADPSDGPPWGVGDVREALEKRAADKRVVLDKLHHDLEAVAADIAAVTGLEDSGATVDIAATWEVARDEAAEVTATLLVDRVTVDGLRAAGARIASAAGSGPAGRIWHRLRRSPVLRAVGAPQDSPARRSHIQRRPAAQLAEPSASLTRRLTDLSVELGGPTGRTLRTELDPTTVERHVTAAAELARSRHPAPAVQPRGAWRAAALLQTLWTAAIVVGAVWWWAEPTAVRPGELPWPVLLLGGGIALAALTRSLLRAAGRRAGDRLARRHRRDLREAVAVHLDRRIGEPTRDLAARHQQLRSILDGMAR